MHKLSDFDYTLPESAIAQNPAEPRDSSRLLVLKGDSVCHHTFSELPDLLEPGDLLVMNNTRVTARRLLGRRKTGGAVEALLMRCVGHLQYEALVKPAKKLRVDCEIEFEGRLIASVVAEGDAGERTLLFQDASPEAIMSAGSVPLPPYIHSSLVREDRYQTVYAETAGSSAAPTAGLHFTDETLERLKARGIGTAFVTLDVGIDTFRPVQTERIEDHKMHGERYFVPEATRDAVGAAKRRIIAVGTTTARVLETASVGKRLLRSGEGCSSIFITPGYRFNTVDALLTNFHMPRTTMIFMVAALCGKDTLLDAYQTALDNNYRFLSFGDSMLAMDQQNGETNA